MTLFRNGHVDLGQWELNRFSIVDPLPFISIADMYLSLSFGLEFNVLGKSLKLNLALHRC